MRVKGRERGELLVCEVPEALSCWNLLAVANTEHPQAGVTKRSPLREGNLRLAHIMTRYRLSDDGPPLPWATGLAVLTAKQAGEYYYAVTVSVDGQEAVDTLTRDQSLAAAVDEIPSKFPAIIYQRTRKPQQDRSTAPGVDVYVCWLEPPLVHASGPVEVYLVCWPAYGAFPDHTLGDFGFKPWQEFIGAMKETRRAFAAVWMSNGPGLVRGVCRDMVPQIKLHQSLPAFSNCSLDTSPKTDHPKGSYRPGKYDDDFQRYADKEGGINLYQRWDPDSIIDEPDDRKLKVLASV